MRKEGNTLELGNEVTKIKVGEIQEDEMLMKEGFNALKKKVDSGDMHYSDSLGYAYEFGIGTSFSIKEAMKYYEMAAKQNNTMGMTNLANLYLRENKFKKAKPLLVKAAEKEYGYAQYLLAMNFFDLYSDNNKEALFWLERAASNDEPHALYQLGLYYGEKADLAKSFNTINAPQSLIMEMRFLSYIISMAKVLVLSKMMIKRYFSLRRLQN